MSRRNEQVSTPTWLSHRRFVPGKDMTSGRTALYSGEDPEGADSWMLFIEQTPCSSVTSLGLKGNRGEVAL